MELSLIQWNVWYTAEIREIGKFLAENPADILCLQELTSGYPLQPETVTWQYISNLLGMDYRLITIPISGDGAEWTQANAIFSRFPISDQRESWLFRPEGKEALIQPRGYIQTTLDIRGVELQIGTTHLSYPNHKDELNSLLSILETNNDKFIFTGDLNADPDSEAIKLIKRYLHNAGPDYSVKTWPSIPFEIGGQIVEPLRDRLDYVFCTPDIEIVSSQIIQTKKSDHLPIKAVVRI